MGWPRNLARRSLRARTRREKALSRLINKLASRKHILAFMTKRKLEQNQSLSDSERAYVKRSLQGEHKVYVLSKTKHGLLGANQVAELNSMFNI